MPDTATRLFHLGDILSITTGRLVSPRHVEGIYDLLGYMVGEPVWTHQLPRASRECEGPLFAQHPQLAEVVVPESFDGAEHVFAWLDEQVQVYGEQLPVTPLDPVDHTSIDPIEELRMMKPDAKVITVEVPDGT